MKKRYLYLIFLALSVIVVLLIALIFKLQKATDTPKIITSKSIEKNENIETLLEVQNYKDSWLTKIKKKKDQKDYSYAVKKFHKEFN